MITFIVCLLTLVLGYFLYGKLMERIIAPDKDKQAPCYAMQDGVDYLPLPTWKVYLIQFLNIAGTGPIFGTIQGILFGPAAYFWIILGCIFGGATHDYMAGMISMKRNGASLPEIIGTELGSAARISQRILAMLLMIMVVVVFVKSPAGLLVGMTGNIGPIDGNLFWVVIIFAYYLIAAILPINKIIGRIYPIFGVVLIFMAICIFFGIFWHYFAPMLSADPNAAQAIPVMPEITDAFSNHHPSQIPLFPGICITIACGAVSGFHATQSPMMARCMKSERLGRRVFYGAMITEGVIALIWAAAAIQFTSTLQTLPDGTALLGNTPYEKLYNLITANGTADLNPAILVKAICNSWLGSFGAIIAILGVIFAPITTGDTALRCARLIAADTFKVKQDKVLKRLLVCMPVFTVCVILLILAKDFGILWRYFAWFNQTFSIFTFFAISVYLAKLNKPYIVTLIPGMFMMCVCVTYICIDPSSLNLDQNLSYGIGAGSALITLVWFIVWRMRYAKTASRLSK